MQGVSPEEAKEIDQWLATSNLNQYGDAPDTVYIGMSVRRAVNLTLATGGNPAFNMETGEIGDRHVYLKNKFPDSPWHSKVMYDD